MAQAVNAAELHIDLREATTGGEGEADLDPAAELKCLVGRSVAVVADPEMTHSEHSGTIFFLDGSLVEFEASDDFGEDPSLVMSLSA